ncbi:MAG TPA: TadE/TadG family type IV pilus assembly protein [Herpetosiphonaceae bacterium]|nr:TadE/TadG family type IV pilus assembly protein [Herpetosiphonaceae bacterium]
MKRKSRGQAMVEFALIFPMIVLTLFMVIDLGFYVYGWATVQFSARRGAEQAARMQPREIKDAAGYQNATYFDTDPCLGEIYREAGRNGALSTATAILPSNIYVTFHGGTTDTAPITSAASNPKKIGNVVQVRVNKIFKPLTPLSKLFFGGRDFEFNAVSRRTIIANGPGYPMVTNGNNYNRCVKS